jgi:aminoglycoside phosphotransferase (APT) family kinase protein
MSREDQIARELTAHLRRALAEPALHIAVPPMPLAGGFDTEIYALRFDGAPSELGGPLVLRVLRAHHNEAMIAREQAVQNALADQGYPAPRVVHACLDAGPLGAPFLLMQRMSGRSLVSMGPMGMDRPLLDAQLRLHALDPKPIADALGEPGTLDGHLASLERRLVNPALSGLTGLMRWLRERRPARATPLVICHGDLHPQNILVDSGRVSGVLDWPNALIAEAAFDVASTRVILRFVPAGLASMSAGLRWLAGLGQPILAARYVRGYRRRTPIDAERLAYYEVAAAMRALVRAGETRSRKDGPPPSALDRSDFADRLLAHAIHVSGVRATLPPPLAGADR